MNPHLTDAAPAMLSALGLAYTYALQTNGVLRVKNQETFCQMRDAIAKATGSSAEQVQTHFEALAIVAAALQAAETPVTNSTETK